MNKFIAFVAGALIVGGITYAAGGSGARIRYDVPVAGAAISPSSVTSDLGKFTALDAGYANVVANLGVGGTITATATSAIELGSTSRITWNGGNFITMNGASGRFYPTGGVVTTNYALGAAPGSLADSSTAPTITACSGGTAATMTWNNGNANFRFDVGTACTSESTAVITLPAATTCWTCSCWNVAAPTHNIKQSGCATTTATMTNYAETLATATDWVDSADIQCMCRGG